MHFADSFSEVQEAELLMELDDELNLLGLC